MKKIKNHTFAPPSETPENLTSTPSETTENLTQTPAHTAENLGAAPADTSGNLGTAPAEDNAALTQSENAKTPIKSDEKIDFASAPDALEPASDSKANIADGETNIPETGTEVTESEANSSQTGTDISQTGTCAPENNVNPTENAEGDEGSERRAAPAMNGKIFLRRVLILAIPIALQNLLTALLNVFDQMMVGWLPGGIADAALSAVLLANQIVFIFQIVIFAVCNTVNIFIAQDTENGNVARIKNRAGFTFALILAISVAFMLVCGLAPSFVIGLFRPAESYREMAEEFMRVVAFSFVPMGLTVGIVFMLRALKKLTAALIVNAVAVAANFFLNYLFMFGLWGTPAYGLVGAAYGTIVARSLEFVAMTVVLFALKNPLIGRPRDMFRFERAFVGRYFKMFFPILCNELFWVLSTTVYLFVYDKLEGSEVVLASVNIAQSLDKIVSVIMNGVGSAVGVVMGNIIGVGIAGEPEKYAKLSIRFGAVTGLVVALLTLASAFVAPAVFRNVSAETHVAARNLIMLYALTAPVRTVCFTQVIGVLRSGGDTTFCMIAETIIIWCISVPLVMVFGLAVKTNMYVIYLLSNVSEVIKMFAFQLRIRHDKWLKFSSVR